MSEKNYEDMKLRILANRSGLSEAQTSLFARGVKYSDPDAIRQAIDLRVKELYDEKNKSRREREQRIDQLTDEGMKFANELVEVFATTDPTHPEKIQVDRKEVKASIRRAEEKQKAVQKILNPETPEELAKIEQQVDMAMGMTQFDGIVDW